MFSVRHETRLKKQLSIEYEVVDFKSLSYDM